MLYDDVFNVIKQNGITTIRQLEKTLSLDQQTLTIVLEKLVKAKKIKNINEDLNCCTTKKNCTGCTLLMNRYYYIVY